MTAALTGISSRLGWFGIAVQSGKGVAATTPTYKVFYNGAPSLKPIITDARFDLTDGSRDQGDAYVSGISVGGDVPIYCHPDVMATLWHAALGANADSGAGPNFTHTITPANDLPWLTCFRMVGGVVWEKYTDCKLNSLTISGQAGQPLTAVLNIMGITSTFQTADPGTNPDTNTPYMFMDGVGALKVDTVAYAMHQWDITVNNNLNPFQADDYALNNIDPQGREISGNYTIRFAGATALPLDYRAFFYGNDSGTTLATTFSTHALDFAFAKNVNLSMDMAIPVAKWADVPVQPDSGGNVIEVQCAYEVERFYSSGVEGNIMSVVCKDQAATA